MSATPSAGSTVPSTSPAGTLTTPIISPVSVRTLTRMLNARPKKALVSPRVHHGIDNGAAAGLSTGGSAGGSVTSVVIAGFLSGGGGGQCVQSRDHGRAVGDPPEDAALGLDHLEADALKVREIRTHAIGYDQAFIAAVVGFPCGGVDAHFGGDSGDQQLPDAGLDEDVL